MSVTVRAGEYQGEATIAELVRAVPKGVDLNVPLSSLSRWKVGGPARVVVTPGSVEEVARIMKIMRGKPEPFCIIGDGSNVLFDSDGFDGVIMLIGRRMANLQISGEHVWAQAGIAMPELAWRAGVSGLSGIEHTVGIPGTLGGLVLMNGGSQRKGIGSAIDHVVCVGNDGEIFSLNQEQCLFAYRTSQLQTLGAAVVEATLRLHHGDPEAIKAEMEGIIESRASRFPNDVPSCGSTFLSDPAMYATVGAPGKAIETVGLKGWRRGDAEISAQHANFFVNRGSATSDDLLWLIALARNTVREATGFSMDCEVRHIARDGSMNPAHVVALARWGTQLTRETAIS